MTAKFKVGDVVRYGCGCTALMRIDHISENHGGHARYYGEHCMGGPHGAYAMDCVAPSDTDMQTWANTEEHRLPAEPSLSPQKQVALMAGFLEKKNKGEI